jgi:hypothetical protein
MKKIAMITVIGLFFFSCKSETKTTEEKSEVTAETVSKKVTEDISKDIAYNSFGMAINSTDALTAERMIQNYNNVKIGDTLNTKMKGKISEVCSKKGCWMKLDMGNDQIVRVTFKDYGFFMPLDASGNVIVNGKAFISETSVEDLKHYAEDAGKSVEEIAAITTPEKTFGFLADGVLIEK